MGKIIVATQSVQNLLKQKITTRIVYENPDGKLKKVVITHKGVLSHFFYYMRQICKKYYLESSTVNKKSIVWTKKHLQTAGGLFAHFCASHIVIKQDDRAKSSQIMCHALKKFFVPINFDNHNTKSGKA